MAGRRSEIEEHDGIAGPGPALWSVRSSRYSFRDRWLAVRSDECVTGDGTIIAPYHVVELPDWINVLALTTAGQIVLVREYRHGTGEITFELPSGTIEAGEDPLATARRELREETGYGGGIWRRTACFAANPARQSNRVFTYLAAGVTLEGPQRPDIGEIIDVVPMAVPALFAGLSDGSLRFQALHLAALFAYLLPVLADPAGLGAEATDAWLARPEPV